MKKVLAYTALVFALLLSGCAGADAPQSTSVQSTHSSAGTQATEKTAKSEAQSVRLGMQVAGKPVSIILADNMAAQSLIAQLPAALEFKDFNNTEKIAYLPHKLNVEDAPKGHAPKAGDMCIYVPWGNICIFYRDYKFSSDLVYLGNVEQGLDTLSAQQSDFKVNLSIVK